MHPTRAELIKYLHADPTARQQLTDITKYLEQCAECRAALARLEDWDQAAAESVGDGLPTEAGLLVDRLYREGVRASRVIDLMPMAIESVAEPARLAADGGAEEPVKVGMEHIATLYAEDPELILRIMRDRRTGEETLHLIGADPAQMANVMIRIVEPSMDFVTNASGMAYLGEQHLDSPADLKWQIRLPDATFTLSPLAYDPEKPAATRRLDLEADEDNRVSVELESRAEGLRLSLTLLRVAGREDLQNARIIISQGAGEFQTATTQAHQSCTITGLDAASPINIRIFAD